MKKKIIIIILAILSIGILGFLIFLQVLYFSLEKTSKEYQQRADEHSQIEYFLNDKSDGKYLVVGNEPKALFSYSNYYIDESNSLYSVMKEITYLDGVSGQEAEALYNVFLVYKISNKSESNQQEKLNAKKYMVDSIEIIIYSSKDIKILSSIDGGLNYANSLRFYHLNDEDYNKLIKELQLVVDNGILFE